MSGLKETINELKDRLKKYQNKDLSEANTEAYFIRPFLKSLGYDTDNPELVWSQYPADPHDIKTGKVDYALLRNGKPIIFVEGKRLHESPLDSHVNQIKRYFNNTREVDFAVLTNGNEYRFYTDLVHKNMLDESPFLKFQLNDIDEDLLERLDQFSSQNFDSEKIKELAHWVYRKNKIYSFFREQFSSPNDKFLRFVSQEIFGTGKRAVRNDVTKILAGIAISTHRSPEPKPPDPEPSFNEEQNIFNIGEVTGKKLDYFRFQNVTISDMKWAEMFAHVLKNLCERDSQKLMQISENIKILKITSDDQSIKNPKSIGHNLFVSSCNSTEVKISILKEVLSSFGMENTLYIKLH